MKKDNKLNEEQLENISGGYIFCSQGISGADPDYSWEVLDEHGNVKGKFESYKKAQEQAGLMGYSDTVIDWNYVCDLRSGKR